MDWLTPGDYLLRVDRCIDMVSRSGIRYFVVEARVESTGAKVQAIVRHSHDLESFIRAAGRGDFSLPRETPAQPTPVFAALSGAEVCCLVREIRTRTGHSFHQHVWRSAMDRPPMVHGRCENCGAPLHAARNGHCGYCRVAVGDAR